ncbi:MAG: aspartate kinase [Bacteroidales bacterium]|nr:aspartate kinase [Bacteroidales bacterium]
MEIYKFGGTSLENAASIRRVVEIISSPAPKIVVLSANGKVTDKLSRILDFLNTGEQFRAVSLIAELEDYYRKLIRQLFAGTGIRGLAVQDLRALIEGLTNRCKIELTEQDSNWLITRGEYFSTVLFCLYLEACGHHHKLMNAAKIIYLDRHHQPERERIKNELNSVFQNHPGTRIFVTQGFVCSGHQGSIETLGRGGSDFTAALLGAAVPASVIQIWSDVDGFLNNDPDFVRGALPLQYLSFDEAAELAYFGARVLHPATLFPAREAGIPVLLKNTRRPEVPGTVISEKQQNGSIKAVAAKDNICSLSIHSHSMLMAYGFLRKVFGIFEKHETAVDMVTTSEVNVSVTIDNTHRLPAILKELGKLGEVSFSDGLSLVCVVGDHLADKRGRVRQVFAALQDIPLRMISYGAARNSIAFLVESAFKVQALEALNHLLSIPENQEHYV